MAIAKAIAANDIIYGCAVVGANGITAQYDPTALSKHFTSATQIDVSGINNRYLYHGGPGGSGNWEH